MADGARAVNPALMAALAAAAAALSTAAVAVALSSPFSDERVLVAVAHALLIAAPVGVGLYVLGRDPGSRFARLLIAAGFLWAPSMLASSSNSVLYSIGRVDGWLVELSAVVLALAFPSGWLSGRLERWLALAACLLVVLLYLPPVLLDKDYPSPSPWSACARDCPHNAFALNAAEPGFVDDVIDPLREASASLLFLGVALTLGLRIAGASQLMRRTLVPVLTGAIVVMIGNAAFLASRHVDRWSGTSRTIGFISLLAVPGFVLGLLVGLLRWRLVAADALRQLVDRFGHGARAFSTRDAIADAIGDPTLWIAYWAGEPGIWVDESGAPVALPQDYETRRVTEVASGGRPVAALVHDAALSGEPAVRDVVRGFAVMALENQRLDAEVRSSVRELKESKARVLHAVDQERQRIERDLHDGAQQRLVALRVGLQLAAETVAANPDGATEALDKLGRDVEEILDEVRALARGVYPPLLADHGIGPALQAAADDGPLPTRVHYSGLGRYSQQIESAVYFSCLEALQNASKHADARRALITLAETDELEFEVRDDGHGFDLPGEGGSGLENMRDRIVALGGRLSIESSPGEGTRVRGSVPIGMANLTPDVEQLFRRATDALEDSFTILRALRDSHGTVIDFVVEHVNDAACRSTGRSREEQVGRALGSLEPAYTGSDLFEWHRQALEADGPSSLDDLLYEAHGTVRRLQRASEVRAAPLGAGRLAVSWHDITERKRAERELNLQAAVLARASEGVCLVRSSDSVIVYANPRLAAIYGYEPDQLVGRRFPELIWEDEPGGAKRRADEILARVAAEGPTSYETRGRRKDGSEIWTETHAASFKDPDHGDVWVIVTEDVTARRQAQDALALSERRLRTAVGSAPMVLFTMDRELRYTWVFNGQSDIHGDRAPVGKTDDQIFGREVGRRLTRINREALAGRAMFAEVELDLPEGPATFELTVQPVWDDDGNVVGVAGAAYETSLGDDRRRPRAAREEPRRTSRRWGRPVRS